MNWNWLIIVFIIFILSWLSAGFVLIFFSKRKKYIRFAKYLPLIGNTAILFFIIFLWISIERPPMRTMAETRLLYSFFVAWVTWIIYILTTDKAIYWLGFIMSSIFLIVDIIHPEYQSKTLMPALQSPWFIPHVVVYMISYSVLGASCFSSLKGLFLVYRKHSAADKYILLSMRLVYPGIGLLTLGMLMGSLWAKIAWGNYWSWDPKETWALLTWLFYLITIHLHFSFPNKRKLLLWLLGLSFIVLIITWMGINFIAPKMNSIHIYGG